MMRISLLCIILVKLSIISFAQIKMDIEALTISKIRNTDVIDTDTLVFREHDYSIPYIEAIIKMTNITDLNLKLSPDDSDFYVTYRYNNRLYKERFYFQTIKGNNIPLRDTLLKPNQEIRFHLTDYLIKKGSFLELQLKNVDDNTDFLLQILPSLRFLYEDKSGLIINQNEIFEVKIKNRKDL